MKQLLLLISLFIHALSSAQILKTVYPASINPEDSNTLVLEYKNSFFTRYQAPFLVIKNEGQAAKIINDSIIEFSFGPFDSEANDSAYDAKLTLVDHSYTLFTFQYPNLIKRKSKEDSGLIIDSSYQFQSLPKFILFKIKARNSHFTNGTNIIKLKPAKAEASAYYLDSIQVINDSLLYGRLNTNNLIELGAYKFYLNNKIDGTLSSLENIQIGYNPFSIHTPKDTVFKKGDTLYISVKYTDEKGKPSLKIGNTNELSLFNSGGTHPVFKTSNYTYSRDSNETGLTHQYKFRIILPLKMKTGLLDVKFLNDSSGTYIFKNAIQVFHDKPILTSGTKSMPGKNFNINLFFYDDSNYPDTLKFSFLKNGVVTNEVVIDSFTQYKSRCNLYGHSSSNAKGQYDFQTETKEDIYIEAKSITISEYFPFAIKLTPNYFYHNQDSAEVHIDLDYNNNIAFYNGVFERNGQAIEGMFIQVDSNNSNSSPIIKFPKEKSPGWYDLKYFNKNNQTWELQRNACYIYGNVSGYEINKSKVAKYGVVPVKVQMKFHGTHFTQSNTAIMNGHNTFTIINDSLVEFPYRTTTWGTINNGDLTSYNNVDGHIPCLPQIELFDYPIVSKLIPSSGNAGDTLSILVYTEMSTFTQFVENTIPIFRIQDQVQNKITIIKREILNDTLLRLQVAIAEDMPASLCDFGIAYESEFVLYQLANAFEVINNGNGVIENKSEKVKIYPNPSKGYVYVDNTQFKFSAYKIYDLKGSLIHKASLESSLNELNLSEILQKKQLYLIELIGEKSVYQRLLIE